MSKNKPKAKIKKVKAADAKALFGGITPSSGFGVSKSVIDDLRGKAANTNSQPLRSVSSTRTSSSGGSSGGGASNRARAGFGKSV